MDGRSSSVIQSLLIKVVFTMASPYTLEVGDVVSHLFDSLDLLLKEVTLQKVSHL